MEKERTSCVELIYITYADAFMHIKKDTKKFFLEGYNSPWECFVYIVKLIKSFLWIAFATVMTVLTLMFYGIVISIVIYIFAVFFWGVISGIISVLF